MKLLITEDLKMEALVKMKELFAKIEKIEQIKKENSDWHETTKNAEIHTLLKYFSYQRFLI